MIELSSQEDDVDITTRQTKNGTEHTKLHQIVKSQRELNLTLIWGGEGGGA